MSEILCSTGALVGLANNRNCKILKEIAGQLECDGFEFMMYASRYEQADEAAGYLREL